MKLTMPFPIVRDTFVRMVPDGRRKCKAVREGNSGGDIGSGKYCGGVMLLWPSVVWAQTGAGSGTHTTPSILPEVTVVDTTPLHSDEIDRDTVPALVQPLHQKITRA
jgi:hypothetical protein